jgi:hypothetical protein
MQARRDGASVREALARYVEETLAREAADAIGSGAYSSAVHRLPSGPRDGSDQVISVFGDIVVAMECRPDSAFPYELRQRGYRAELIGPSQRIIASAITERLTRSSSGVFVCDRRLDAAELTAHHASGHRHHAALRGACAVASSRRDNADQTRRGSDRDKLARSEVNMNSSPSVVHNGDDF